MNESASSSVPMILAAGGIVQYHTAGGWKMAVVHRKRYNDWSLPKGKLEANETPERAALREIREETGCEGVIMGFAGMTRYVVGDTQKFVFFWNVRAFGKGAFTPSEEVDRIEWLSRQDAMERLTYEAEKKLVSQTCPEVTFNRSCPSPRRHRWSRDHRRLCNAIQGTRVEIDDFLECGCGQGGDLLCRVASALRSFQLAEQGLCDNDINGGWEHLNRVRRKLLYVLDETALNVKLVVQRKEAADKLSSWRLKAYRELLPENTIPKVATIAEAQNLLDEHAGNRWLKIWALKTQLQIIISVLVLAVIGIIVLSASTGPLFWLNPDDGAWQFILGVALFGVLGASFSGALSVAGTKAEGRIPDQVVFNWITLMRLALGGGAAIAAYCFLQMKLLQLGDGSNEAVYFGVAFVAGFGERFIVKTVEKLSGKHADDGRDITQKETP